MEHEDHTPAIDSTDVMTPSVGDTDGAALSGAVDVDQSGPTPVNRRGAALVLGAIVVVLAGFFGYVAMAPKGRAVDGTLPADPVGYELPNVTLPSLNAGSDLSLASLRGKVIVVNFWASWCGPCKEEAATLAAAEQEWRDKGVVFIGIDSEDKNADAKEFESTYGIAYESLVDPAGDIGAAWSVTGYPETFFVSKDGRIVSKWISNIDAVSLNKSIQQALTA